MLVPVHPGLIVPRQSSPRSHGQSFDRFRHLYAPG